MDLIASNYQSGSDAASDSDATDLVNLALFSASEGSKRTKVTTNPDVNTEDLESAMKLYARPDESSMRVNLRYDELTKPLAGPENPFRAHGLAGTGNMLTGHVDAEAFSEHTFRDQERTFRTLGYANDPSLFANTATASCATLLKSSPASGFIGDQAQASRHQGHTGHDSQVKRNQDRKRKAKGDSSVLEGEAAYKGPWAGYENESIGQPTGPPPASDQADAVVAPGATAGGKPKGGKSKEIRLGEEQSTFHGKQEFDYQGRTYMHVPNDVSGVDLNKDPGSLACFAPKQLVHTWTGHTKGVSAIRLFPRSGHLLLSASMDTKVKLWDVYHDRRCLRTFLGHNKAIRDICFTNNGRQFLSASYDRYIKLWDTETGQCIRSFTTGKIPYCVKFHPDADQQHIFLAGCSDNKVVQFDLNSPGDQPPVQEYDQHLGAVNSITFIDDNRRFVSTSDDKTMRLWEFGIPITIKLIAEPSMHSIPSVSLSPNNKWLAGQSLDNQILIYSARQRLRMNYKKKFTGHLVAGYACQPNFSPDGRFIMSGDAEGYLWVWDWKSQRVRQKLKAHDNVVIGCEWHPQETSKVVTCSWDGLIKYWD
ncbi:hypothetical protein H4R34_004302 [Dimargaris verticillata]|uniref:Pre-mRNA-processing factor 17 n=1 Tax=Dimargaris verticillata TaxID=2761393 RepID=A0A9W8B4K7_9FUNG|nr:hypothetical protein H4R34_004302 [Dimargaris verticillata]